MIKSGTDRASFEKAYNTPLGRNQNPDTMRNRKFLGNSCLRPSYLWSDDNHYARDLPHHPAQAYASGDFTTFWAEDGQGKCMGRVVVMTKDKGKPVSGPVYGLTEQTMDALEAKVEDLASSSSWNCWGGDWEGAKMLCLPFKGDIDNGYIAPYLDVEPSNLDPYLHDSDYLVITRSGSICAGSYRGVLQGSHSRCSQCNDALGEDESYHSENTGEDYCEHCYDESHARCESDSEYYHLNEMTSVNHSGRWGLRCAWVADCNLDGYAVYCSDDEWWHDEEVSYCEFEDTYVAQASDDDAYFFSDWDGELYPVSEICMTDCDESVSKDELENDDETWVMNNDGVWCKKEEEEV